MTVSENPWEEVDQQLLAKAIRNASDRTRQELADALQTLI
jgi:hypothetical protein